MHTYSKVKLSGSTDGRGILVAATAIGSGTTIHTAQSGSLLDIITLYVVNTDTVVHKLTIGWGGTTDPDDLIEVRVLPEAGLMPVVLKLPLTNGLIVKAAADVANMLVIHGEVSRIS